MTKKKSAKKNSSTHKDKTHACVSSNLETTLVQNIIELQKVHTDMAEKFDKLSREISHLLALFETTARTFAKNAPVGEYEKDKDFLMKIDKLLDQNKTLAKGLTLMEERLRERMYGSNSPVQEEQFKSSISQGKRPLPRF
ncbi:MAG: hypothetical protein ABIG28_01460 [archaeon]